MERTPQPLDSWVWCPIWWAQLPNLQIKWILLCAFPLILSPRTDLSRSLVAKQPHAVPPHTKHFKSYILDQWVNIDIHWGFSVHLRYNFLVVFFCFFYRWKYSTGKILASLDLHLTWNSAEVMVCDREGSKANHRFYSSIFRKQQSFVFLFVLFFVLFFLTDCACGIFSLHAVFCSPAQIFSVISTPDSIVPK